MSSVLREQEQRREAEKDAIIQGRLAAQEHPGKLRKIAAALGVAALVTLGVCVEYDHKLPVSFGIDFGANDE